MYSTNPTSSGLMYSVLPLDLRKQSPYPSVNTIFPRIVWVIWFCTLPSYIRTSMLHSHIVRSRFLLWVHGVGLSLGLVLPVSRQHQGHLYSTCRCITFIGMCLSHPGCMLNEHVSHSTSVPPRVHSQHIHHLACRRFERFHSHCTGHNCFFLCVVNVSVFWQRYLISCCFLTFFLFYRWFALFLGAPNVVGWVQTIVSFAWFCTSAIVLFLRTAVGGVYVSSVFSINSKSRCSGVFGCVPFSHFLLILSCSLSLSSANCCITWATVTCPLYSELLYELLCYLLTVCCIAGLVFYYCHLICFAPIYPRFVCVIF